MSNTEKPAEQKRSHRFLRIVLLLMGLAVSMILAAWASAALYFDLLGPQIRAAGVVCFALVILLALVFVKPMWRALLVWMGGFLVVFCWWHTLEPSNTRAWLSDVSQTAWAEIQGDQVILHNVRNCDYVAETNYTVHWETRSVQLSKLSGVDIALTFWGSPWIAHPIVCFRFVDGPPVAISIETRKEEGEGYSAVRGLFRHYELIYIVADERDVIRLRTNYRQGEDVYLYRTKATPEQARQRFLEYLARLNELHTRPAWYNALTDNCTTSIRAQRAADERRPFDWRIILNGKSDEMAYERGALISGGLSFPELKQRCLINPRAKAADKSPDFSKAIREGLPE